MRHSQAWDVASTLAVSSFLGGGLLRVRLVVCPRGPGRFVTYSLLSASTHPSTSVLRLPFRARMLAFHPALRAVLWSRAFQKRPGPFAGPARSVLRHRDRWRL